MGSDEVVTSLRRALGAIGILLAVVLTGCASVGSILVDAEQTEGLDDIAVLPTGAAAPDQDGAYDAVDSSESEFPAGASSESTDVSTTTELPSPEDLGPAELCGDLGPAWCDDGDGNFVPDEIESELGYDPDSDDCRPSGCPTVASVEDVIVEVTTPLLVAVDASLAMQQGFGDSTRTEAAQQAVTRLVTGLPDFVATGLMSFGSRIDAPPASDVEACSSAQMLAFPSRMTTGSVATDVQAVSNTGQRPLAGMSLIAGAALLSARGDTDEGSDGSPGRLVVIAAGGDTCGATVADAVTALGARPPVVEVIGLAVAPGEDGFLRELAAQTGGSYTDVASPEALSSAVDAIAARPTEQVRDVLCQVTASRAAQTCRGTFGTDVLNLLGRRSSEWRDQGRAEDADRLVVFAGVLDRSLADDDTSIPAVDPRIEELYMDATTARERFVQAYGTPLPGPELATATACPIVGRFA